MSIYNPIIITEEIRLRFKPTRLYIKELNGIRYFGKTIKQNAHRYSGSGDRWSKQIKKYGRENIQTIWVSEWFYTPEDVQEFALLFSEYYNVVTDRSWANLKSETGLDGGSGKGHMKGIPKPKSVEHRKSISDTLNGITLEDRHGIERANEIRTQMSASHTGKKQTSEAIAKTVSYHTGRKRSQETINNLIECRKHYKKHTCEHCGIECVPANYYRWHGDNCKQNANSSRYTSS